MANAQNWLNNKYPINGRNEITKLDIGEKLDCSDNYLTEIIYTKITTWMIPTWSITEKEHS